MVAINDGASVLFYKVGNSDLGSATILNNGLFANPVTADTTFPTTTQLINGARPLKTGDIIETSGYANPGDGGGAKWKVTGNTITASQTPLATVKGAISDASGKEYVIIDDTIIVNQLGCLPTATATNNVSALKACAGEANIRGGCNILFEAAKTYNIFSTGTIPPGNSPLMAFSSLSYVKIDYRGATLNFEATFSGADTVDIHKFTSCDNIEIVNCIITSIAEIPAERGDRGIIFASYLQGCKNINASNNKQTGGKNGHLFLRNPIASDPLSYKSSNANINHETINVGYPLTAAYSGDNLEATIISDGALRSYYPYGVENHNIKVISKNHISDDCLLTAETFSTTETTERKLNNINLDYTNIERTVSDSANPCITVRFVGTNTGTMNNINIKYNCKNDATYPLGKIVYMLKQSNFGVTDTIARAHIIRGIKISGVLDGANSGQQVLDLMNDGSWTSGDFTRGFTVEDTVVTGNTAATATILADSVIDRVNIENVTFSGDLTVSGTYQIGVNYRNVLANNQSRDVTFIDSVGGAHGLT